MFPPEFDYRRPERLSEAIDALSAPDARPLAGGHALLPAMKRGDAAPATVVDVSGLDALCGVERGDGATRVGACVTHADLLADDRLADDCPVVPRVAANLGDWQVRNRGTVGGNLAAAVPGSDLPAAALAADATVHVRGPDGARDVDAADLFVGGGTTLADDELLTGVTLPHAPATGAAYARETHPASGWAMVGVAAAVAGADGDVTDARVAAVGVHDPPLRLPAVEEALVEGAGASEAADRAPAALADGSLVGDAHASGAFRRELLAPVAERAVTEALGRATRGTDAGGGTAGGGAAGPSGGVGR
jgi:carbon-monoxide dehydrogenase medium subunit